MEKPIKPELQTEAKTGQYGETVIQLTQESEQVWANYLRQDIQYRQHLGSLALQVED